MKKGLVAIFGLGLILTIAVAARTIGETRSDLCGNIDMKPVLSLQQIRQSELVHYLVVLSGSEVPSAEGKTPEQFYEQEVKILIDHGYPPSLAEIEPGRIVTRRYFAQMVFQVLSENDPSFKAKYGDQTSETGQLDALLQEGYIFAEEGNIYKEEILAVLCRLPVPVPREEGVIEISPVLIQDVSLEVPLSPI